MKTKLQRLIGLLLAITGYRFNKHHRVNETVLYRLINTTLYNIQADQQIIDRYKQIMN